MSPQVIIDELEQMRSVGNIKKSLNALMKHVKRLREENKIANEAEGPVSSNVEW